MGDQYPGYCPHCVDKDKPNTDFLCASNGYPSFWPHKYPNCFRADEGVEISVGGRVTPAPEEPETIEVAAGEVLVLSATTTEVTETAITGTTEDAPEEETNEDEVAALEGDVSVVDELIESGGVEEVPEDEDEELYGEDTAAVEEEKELPIAAIADVDAKGLYYCTECEHNHNYKSDVGKQHLEHAGDPPQ